MTKTRDAAAAELNKRQRRLRAVEACVRPLGDQLDTLKRRESTHCDIEVKTLKVTDAQGSIINIVTSLHRDAVSSYIFILGESMGP